MAAAAVPSLELQHAFLDLCKVRRFDDAKSMLRLHPSLVNVQPSGRWSALHQAAEANDQGMVRHLLRCGANVMARTSNGKQPWEVAGAGSELQRLLHDASAGLGAAAGAATADFAPRTYDKQFAHAVCMSALIGDRHDHQTISPDTGRWVLDGLTEELRKLQGRHQALQTAGRTQDATALNDAFKGLTDLNQQIKTKLHDNPRVGAIVAYTAECFLYPAVNRALRERDESMVGLAPFVRLLHDSLALPEAPLARHTAKCWRWVNLMPKELEQYKFNASYKLQNLIVWPGFTSACRDGEQTWRNMETFGPRSEQIQVLCLIEQEAGGSVGPVDVSIFSEFPEEAEVLYPIGQQFELLEDLQTYGPDELVRELGPRPGDVQAPNAVRVLRLRAVEAFYDFCMDFFRGGGTAEDAVPICRHRLAFEQARGDRWGEARALHALGMVFKETARFEEALASYEAAKDIQTEVAGARHPDVASSLNNLGNVLQNLGRFEEALQRHQESLEIKREVLGPRHPDVATSLNNLGVVLEQLGRFQEALQRHQESLEIRREVLGPRHPDVASSLCNLGVVLKQLGRFEEALQRYEEDLEITREVKGPRHPEVAASLNNLGNVLEQLGRFEEALQRHQDSLDIRREVKGPRHPDVATSLNNLGIVLKKLGRFEEALHSYQESLEITREVKGPRHPDVATSLYNMAILLNKLGRKGAALGCAQEALEVWEVTLGKDHPDSADARLLVQRLRRTT